MLIRRPLGIMMVFPGCCAGRRSPRQCSSAVLCVRCRPALAVVIVVSISVLELKSPATVFAVDLISAILRFMHGGYLQGFLYNTLSG